jgi:hypothetical protein
MLCVCDRTITGLYYDSRQELFASLDFYLQIIVSIIYDLDKILDLSIIHNVFCQSLSLVTINKTDKLAFVFNTFDCIFNVKSNISYLCIQFILNIIHFDEQIRKKLNTRENKCSSYFKIYKAAIRFTVKKKK